MTPRLQGEIDKGLEKIRRHQYDAARSQFEKAAKMAPANPDIQYLLGMVEYSQEHFDAARAKFQAALSIYPSHERSLLALGELQIRAGDDAGAVPHAARAAELGKEHAAPAWMLLGQILGQEGKRAEATKAFESVVRSFPNDPSASEAKKQLSSLNTALFTNVSN